LQVWQASKPNTVYAARGSSDCIGEAQSAGAAAHPDRGELTVFLSEWPGFAKMEEAFARPTHGLWCAAGIFGNSIRSRC